MLKPLGLSGSRGVIRADDPDSFRAAWRRIEAILSAARTDRKAREEGEGSRILVESFVPGPEVALEGLLRDGRLELLALFDKPDPLDGPFFEETIYVTPSRHPPGVQDAVVRTIAAAAEALGLREGPIHAEARLGPDGPVILEVAARTIGGLCARALRFGAGASLEEIVVAHAMGLPLASVHRESRASGVMMLPIPRRGVLHGVSGLEGARAVAGVEDVVVTVPEGREVVPLPEGDAYLGFLFARGETPGCGRGLAPRGAPAPFLRHPDAVADGAIAPTEVPDHAPTPSRSRRSSGARVRVLHAAPAAVVGPGPGPHRTRSASGAASAADRARGARRRRWIARGGRGPAARAGGRYRRPHHHLLEAGDGAGDAGCRPISAPPAVMDPAVAGEWRWLGSASVEFAPAEPLPNGTRFTVTVPAGLRAVDGSVLAEPYTFSFETRRPAVLRVDPRDGWAWVTPKTRFSITFDRPVADLARHLSLRAGGEEIPVRVTGSFSVAEEERALRGGTREESASMPGFEDRRTRYEVTPGKALPLDAAVQLSLGAEVQGTEGPLPLGEGRRWNFRSYGPMVIQAAQACDGVDLCPYGPLLVKTSNPAEPGTIRSRVVVEPPVEIDWERVEVNEPSEWDDGWSPHFSLPGRFRPGVEYRVTIGAGVADVFGQQAAAARVAARTSDLQPSFEMARGAALLEAAGDGALPVEAENLSRLEATVWKLTPADVARVLAEPRRRKGSAPALPPSPRTRTIDLGRERNVTKTRPLPVRQILGGARSALFYASVRAPELDPKRSPPVTVVRADHRPGGARQARGHPRGGLGHPPVRRQAGRGSHRGDPRRPGQGDSGTGKADAEGICDVPGLGGKDEWSVRSPENAWLVAATLGDDTGVTLSQLGGLLQPVVLRRERRLGRDRSPGAWAWWSRSGASTGRARPSTSRDSPGTGGSEPSRPPRPGQGCR